MMRVAVVTEPVFGPTNLSISVYDTRSEEERVVTPVIRPTIAMLSIPPGLKSSQLAKLMVSCIDHCPSQSQLGSW